MKDSRGTPGQHIAEWTNSDATVMYQRRDAAREKYFQRSEITRSRVTVAAASHSFFDRLASLPIHEAIQVRQLSVLAVILNTI